MIEQAAKSLGAIDQLIIRDFRGIKNLTLDWPVQDDRVVVLAGANGSGKTSVLEALLICLGGAQLLPQPRRKAALNIRLGVPNSPFELRPRAQSAHRILFYFSSSRSQSLAGSLALTLGDTRDDGTSFRESNRLRDLKQYLINKRASDLLRADEGRSEHVAGPPSYKEVVRRLARAWSYFYPAQSEASFSVGEVITNQHSRGAFEVFFQLPGQARVSLDDLSTGQQELVTMFGNFACGNFNNAVVIIDEPELHLDRSWHRVIMRSLREFLPTSQFVVATHSPEVIDSVYSFQRLFLERSPDGVKPTWGGGD